MSFSELATKELVAMWKNLDSFSADECHKWPCADTSTVCISRCSYCHQPIQAQWCQMVTLQSVQGHTGLTHAFNFWHSGTLALKTECQSARMSEIRKCGLYQYGAECFGRLISATIRKSLGLKGLR